MSRCPRVLCDHCEVRLGAAGRVIRPEPAPARALGSAGSARRCHTQSLGRAIVPELRSCHRCQDGLISSPCPRSCRPRSAPGGAVGDEPSLPSTRATTSHGRSTNDKARGHEPLPTHPPPPSNANA
eukprot:scaffold9451_cov103-Isochrysis_galbana.AAC.2